MTTRSDWKNCCSSCRIIGETWGHGDIQVGEVNAASAGYVSDYVTKHKTKTYTEKLKGRQPEFARMSLRPGLGALYVPRIHDKLEEIGYHKRFVDVPSTLVHGTSHMPLGRYLRVKLREMAGLEKGCPAELLAAYQAEMLELRKIAKASETQPSAKKEIMASFAGAVMNMEAKYNLFGTKKGKL